MYYLKLCLTPLYKNISKLYSSMMSLDDWWTLEYTTRNLQEFEEEKSWKINNLSYQHCCPQVKLVEELSNKNMHFEHVRNIFTLHVS